MFPFGKKSSGAPPSSSMTGSVSLLDELADALIGAVAVYGMADVRRLLRAGQPPLLGDPLLEKAMKLPIDRLEMMRILQANTQVLQSSGIPTDLYLGLLQTFSASVVATEHQANWLSIFKNQIPTEDDPLFVAVFDDDNSDKELVYYIAVDRYVTIVNKYRMRGVWRNPTRLMRWF
jgi:DNA polymerase III psi subunit